MVEFNEICAHAFEATHIKACYAVNQFTVHHTKVWPLRDEKKVHTYRRDKTEKTYYDFIDFDIHFTYLLI